MTSQKHRLRLRGKIILVLMTMLLLLMIFLQAHFLWLSGIFEEIGCAAFRILVWATLPVRILLIAIAPAHDHHYPLSHWILLALLSPLVYWGLWEAYAWREARRRLRSLSSNAPGHPTHRRLISKNLEKIIIILILGAFFLIGMYATVIEPERLVIRNYDIPVKDLPESLDGLRIMLISDTHYGPYTSLHFIQRAIKRANQLEPDIVMLGGDYVHRTPRSIKRGIGVLASLQSRFGSVAVIGNHEHWEGADECRAALKQVGIRLVENEHLFLTSSGVSDSYTTGDAICIAGVGDLWDGEVLIEDTLAGVSPAMPRLLLSHNPDVAEMIQRDERVDLVISGHTHGGQVWLPFSRKTFAPTAYGSKYVGGLCSGLWCPVIVSRGIGLAGLPVRFMVPPEICLITLTRPKAVN